MKLKPYVMRFTPEQVNKLKERAEALGFSRRSDYIRFVLFMELSFAEKMDQIHRKVCIEDD